jgi:hypothetical protein
MRRSILLTVFAAMAAIATACQPPVNTKPAVTSPTSTPVVVQSPAPVASPSISPTASPATDKKDEKKVDDKKGDAKATPIAKTTVTPEKK